MSMAEQPLKKRKLYSPSPPGPSPPPSSPLPQPPPPPQQRPDVPPPPHAQEEIAYKRRSREEIRNVYETVKRIKKYVGSKEARSKDELEQAYLSLISASRGCSSVQRILSEFIPRYASYCPTALEAAAKVIINMHNLSMAVINREEDSNSIAFQTAKACILGLVDICCIASSEAPTSTVIRGICSTVFQNLLSFLIPLFEGRDIFQIVEKETTKVQDSSDSFLELKQKIIDEDEPSVVKLSKLRALCLLQLYFRCPKDILAACFEQLNSKASEEVCIGQFFLTQVTKKLDVDGLACKLDETCYDPETCNISSMALTEGTVVDKERSASDGNNVSSHQPALLNNLLGLVLEKDSLLRNWIYSKYKKLSKLPSFRDIPEISSVMEGIFKSFTDLNKIENGQINSDDDCEPSKYSSQPYSGTKRFNQHDHTLGMHIDEACTDRTSGHLKHRRSVVPRESDSCSNTGSSRDSGGSRSMDFDAGEHGVLSRTRSSMQRDTVNHQMFSPHPQTPTDFGNSPFECRNNVFHSEKNHKLNVDHNSPASRGCSIGPPSSSFASPKHHIPVPNSAVPGPIVWYTDGDPAAMDIFSASKQLWVGSLGANASEAHIRFQLDKFGPVEQFSFVPRNGFAVVEYKHIIDAVKAREYVRRQLPWSVRFVDDGPGSRGAMNGVGIGSSTYVYVGNVSSSWARDEILHELRKVVMKGPSMVTELSCEFALLMGFESPEEAATVMAQLRKHRREKSAHMPPLNTWQANVTMPNKDSTRSMPHPIYADVGNNPGLRPRPSENHGMAAQGGQHFHSNWPVSGFTEVPDSTKVDSYNSKMMTDPSQGGGHVRPGIPGHTWMPKKPEMEHHRPLGCAPMTQGPPIPPPQQIQPRPYVPVYHPPNSPWDARGSNSHFQSNQVSPGVIPHSYPVNSVPAPFIPASVTPLAQVQGRQMQHTGQMSSRPPQHLPSVAPPQPEGPPPLLPSPPPLPHTHPPAVPPPPCSPPPPPLVAELSSVEYLGQSESHIWQGNLCKSGVHYCTVLAQRVASDICKYTNANSEPNEWPAKLDMMKRTDLRHVRSSFTNTPPHKREVCRLIPSCAGDHKRFQDFISYLKQRECVGVIKIPAANSMWARLLFILPFSHEACSMLAIDPNPSDCLIALVLPKETNAELA